MSRRASRDHFTRGLWLRFHEGAWFLWLVPDTRGWEYFLATGNRWLQLATPEQANEYQVAFLLDKFDAHGEAEAARDLARLGALT